MKMIRVVALGFFFWMNSITPLRGFAKNEAVTVEWLGQSCFLIQANSFRILVDPYGSQVGYPVHPVKADVVFISHEHFDHNNAAMAPGAKVYRGLKNNGAAWNIFEQPLAPGISLRTIGVYHDEAHGKERGLNSVSVFTIDSLHLVHLGDLGHLLTPEEVRAIGPVDVLFIPVGGVYTIDGAQAKQVAAQLHPRLIIPMHYKTPLNVLPLNTAESFLTNAPWPVKRLHADTLILAKDKLPAQTTVEVLTPEPLKH